MLALVSHLVHQKELYTPSNCFRYMGHMTLMEHALQDSGHDLNEACA